MVTGWPDAAAGAVSETVKMPCFMVSVGTLTVAVRRRVVRMLCSTTKKKVLDFPL